MTTRHRTELAWIQRVVRRRNFVYFEYTTQSDRETHKGKRTLFELLTPMTITIFQCSSSISGAWNLDLFDRLIIAVHPNLRLAATARFLLKYVEALV